VGLWAGHGGFTPGSTVTVQMMQRFANMYGCQKWRPAMICWGLGGFGVGLTGALKVNTKEDMAENSRMIVLGAQTLPVNRTQPGTSSRHGDAAPKSSRSTCEERRAQSDEVLHNSTWVRRRPRVGRHARHREREALRLGLCRISHNWIRGIIEASPPLHSPLGCRTDGA
jgi:hypothetical protein